MLEPHLQDNVLEELSLDVCSIEPINDKENVIMMVKGESGIY